MNLYLRYFDREILVDNVDDAIAFLAGIDEIGMNPVLEQDIRNYVASDVFYPKRYKTRPRVYFIIIKTEAATMQDFKEKKALHNIDAVPKPVPNAVMRLTEEREGWYEGAMTSSACCRYQERVSSSIVTPTLLPAARLFPDRTATIVLSTT